MPENTVTTNNTTKNEINFLGKLTAGLLLIFLTSAAIYLVIAYWPNKMPPITEGDDAAWYTNRCFNVTLIEEADSGVFKKKESLDKSIKTIEKKIAELKDSLKIKKDSTELIVLTDSLKKLKTGKDSMGSVIVGEVKKIHLNTILLLLVALMGFLGNMIHVATSLTTYVGMGTFQRSWVLWYFVKPFTAAALAIIIYFIIRAGFLSYGTGASGVSLYGILSLSALAGLFTDSATLKLKEIFEVIFKTKDERTGKLQGDDDVYTITNFSPEPLPANGESKIVLTGKNLNKADIKITIDGVVVSATIIADKIEIKYTPTPESVIAGKAVLLITDKTGETLYTKNILIK